MADNSLVLAENIEHTILLLRGHRVMLDADLADLYGVQTRALVQAVRRNIERFPADFAFQLTFKEALRSRSQTVILNAQPPETQQEPSPTVDRPSRGSNIKYLPYAFTEQGVAMLSSVLRSPRAVLGKKYDAQFKVVFDAIRELMTPPEKPKRRIGFGAGEP